MIRFILNDIEISTDQPKGMVLLDFIRYHRQLKGTKIGCREGDCGACTVLVGELINERIRYRSVTSCLMPLGNSNGKHIVTIEGINGDGLNPIQQAMADEGATQCGFCTPGFVMSLAGYCLSDHARSPAQAVGCMDGNICRCTGYKSIERAALRVNEMLSTGHTRDAVQFAAANKLLPDYFAGIEKRLIDLNIPENQEHVGINTSAIFVAGGTDLYVQKHDAMTYVDNFFISGKSKLHGIAVEGNRCILGGSTTVTDLCESEIIAKHFPDFSSFAKLVSSTPIRNMATLAGNFVNASPIGDFTVFFLALNASLVLSDGDQRRELPLRKFYKSYKVLHKKPEEFIEQIFFNLPEKKSRFNFEKVSKRTHLDIASVNSAMQIVIEEGVIINADISAGGVGPVPIYLEKTSGFLHGKTLSPRLIGDSLQVMQTEIAPISDARGSEQYKRFLLGQLMKAHFISLCAGEIKPDEIIFT